MKTKLYHLILLHFGSVKNAMLFAALVGVLLLCIIAAVCCYFHLKVLNQRNRQGRVHKAPPAPRRRAPVRMVNNQSESSMNQHIQRAAPVVNEDRRSESSFEKVQGSSSSEVTAEKIKKSTVNKPELKVVPEKKEKSPLEKFEYVKGHVHSSTLLLRDVSRRMNSLELLMGDKVYLANTEVNLDLIQTRRILRAIHGRVRQLDALLVEPSQEGVDAAYEIACSNLTIPSDTVNALLDAENLEPIEPALWMNVIDTLLSNAEAGVKRAINQ